jgi:hypothetical protein
VEKNRILNGKKNEVRNGVNLGGWFFGENLIFLVVTSEDVLVQIMIPNE